MNDILINIHNDEWLSRLLSRYKLTPLRTFLVVVVLNVVLDFILAAFTDTWTNNSEGPGLFGDYGLWVWDIFLVPLFIAYFCWLQSAGTSLFRELADEGVIIFDESAQQTLSQCVTWLQRRSTFRIGFLFALLYFLLVIVVILNTSTPIGWVYQHDTVLVIRTLATSIGTYAFALVLYDLVILNRTLRKLLADRPIHVELYNPDGAGGFGSIGRFSSNLGYAIGAIGLGLSVMVIQSPARLLSFDDKLLIIGIILYLVMAPAIFWLPLRSGHSSMKRYRDGLLSEVSKEIDANFAKLREDRTLDAKNRDALLGRIRQLKEEHGLILEFPIWPVNFGNVRKYFGLTFSTLIPAIFSVFIEQLLV